MYAGIGRIATVWLGPVLLGIGISLVASHYLPQSAEAEADRQANKVPAVRFKVVGVDLPASSRKFPPGINSDLIVTHCLMCHSPGMILEQPPLTESEWAKVTNKMRSHFGAPIPEDDISAIARYLSTINGRPNDSGPSVIDDQAS